MKAGWTISAVLHGAVLAWGLVTFATKPLNATPPEFISTDIISDADFSQITQGIRSAPKTPQAASSICRDRIAANSSANPSSRCACLFTSETNLL